MSSFWSAWIIVLTVANVAGCYWLVRWTMKSREGEAAKGDVTGHTWDGDLQEYNNPLPRWWLWLFYGTLIFTAGYLILYPGLGSYAGMFGWSQESQYEEEMARANAKYGPIYAQYREVPIPELSKNAEATGMGKRLFLTYCIQCHGSDASGSKGFPNLTDNDWLWGGSPEQITATITNGRQAAMPAWGPILKEEGVDNVANYVMTLSGRQADAAKAEAGKKIFQTNCIACHGPEGKGNPMLGSANLTDDIWLYGKSPAAIKKTIAEGRNGKMPSWSHMLSGDKIHLLTAYVYGLSNN